MLRRLYDWVMAIAASPAASPVLGVVAFLHSIVLPIPPDALLIPMTVADRKSWLWYASLAMLTSVAGGIVAFLAGALFFEQVAQPILQLHGYSGRFNAFSAAFHHWGLWIILIAAFTRFPYKVVAIASGAMGLGLPVFVLASFVSRGLRFYAVAGALYLAWPTFQPFVERHLGLLFSLFLALVAAGVAVAYFLG